MSKTLVRRLGVAVLPFSGQLTLQHGEGLRSHGILSQIGSCRSRRVHTNAHTPAGQLTRIYIWNPGEAGRGQGEGGAVVLALRFGPVVGYGESRTVPTTV